ncbi:HigA family addiction module antitoxin [Pectobacterium versatile]|uniref:HigA family addiction module antitoxin n=1 Tax=Pectobacterium versatile TaxID=2488639 RepID=UPI001F34F059|nr:HigA family addiction module antitoxin [Pectobacterium versatile]
MHNPSHPADVLREYLGHHSVAETAKQLNLSEDVAEKLLNGDMKITPDIAAQLETALHASAEMWLGIQSQYDAWNASLGI